MTSYEQLKKLILILLRLKPDKTNVRCKKSNAISLSELLFFDAVGRPLLACKSDPHARWLLSIKREIKYEAKEYEKGGYDEKRRV